MIGLMKYYHDGVIYHGRMMSFSGELSVRITHV